MIYNLKDLEQVKRFHKRVQGLIDKGARVDLTEKRGQRTLNQNSYFYLLLGIAGLELGYTTEEMKQILKTRICVEIFAYGKDGCLFVRSTADLDSKEMTDVIDKFKVEMAKMNIYLPDTNEQEKLDAMAAEIQKHYQWS